jgi:hypothetical protein
MSFKTAFQTVGQPVKITIHDQESNQRPHDLNEHSSGDKFDAKPLNHTSSLVHAQTEVLKLRGHDSKRDV